MSGDLVKIKPLEWRDAFGTQCAGSIFGFYAIRERGWEHVVHLRGEEISRHASPEKAMVGAQEHHDAVVRGVLEPTQAAAELTRLRSKVEYWQKDSAAAWDKCEQRRLENAELVEALSRAQKLIGLVTIRQAINAGDAAIDAAGLNPWCINEGLAEGHEPISAWWLDALLSRVSGGGK